MDIQTHALSATSVPSSPRETVAPILFPPSPVARLNSKLSACVSNTQTKRKDPPVVPKNKPSSEIVLQETRPDDPVSPLLSAQSDRGCRWRPSEPNVYLPSPVFNVFSLTLRPLQHIDFTVT